MVDYQSRKLTQPAIQPIDNVIDEGMGANPSFCPGNGHGAGGVLLAVGGIAWIEERAGQGDAGPAEDVLGPNGLALFDENANLLIIGFSAPDTNTVLAKHLLDFDAGEIAFLAEGKTVHRSVQEPANCTV
jgi:hypothetical protein